jgi:hypothetical protein
MLELNAQAFYSAATELQRIRGIIADEPGIEETADGGLHVTMLTQQHPVVETVLGCIANLRGNLTVLGARVTLMALEELEAVLEGVAQGEPVLKNSLETYLSDIDSRFFHELTLTKVLVLEARDQRYFEPHEALFGDTVAIGFPTFAVFEIDEAGKCLGLGRPTAAVFHLMRTTEGGIRAVAACLGIPDPVKAAARNWGDVLRTIKAELDRRNAMKPAGWSISSDRQFFEEVYVSLDAIRNPWRNATMHVENKYTDDEAEHIFIAVKGFMKKLASRCDEAGNPKA